MTAIRERNIVGALAFLIADDIFEAVAAHAPEAGPTAAALALLDHAPGLSIRTLATGVRLSHAGTVRLVDRLVAEGLVERRGHATDKRTRSLYLTEAGMQSGSAVHEARDAALSANLAGLSKAELQMLGKLAEKILRSRVKDEDRAYHICRLCNYAICDNCPVEAELVERGVIESFDRDPADPEPQRAADPPAK